MTKLDELLHEVQSELSGEVLGTDVVGLDGLSVAGFSANPNFDGAAASARFAMVMKLASKVAGKIGMGTVDDVLTVTDNVYIITRFIGDGSYYWGLTIPLGSTLGLARMVMNEYADKLWEAVPH
jgi:predicted regulator of Ras-like GTPase activity (Roadblock/LC7/MglB family)